MSVKDFNKTSLFIRLKTWSRLVLCPVHLNYLFIILFILLLFHKHLSVQIHTEGTPKYFYFWWSRPFLEIPSFCVWGENLRNGHEVHRFQVFNTTLSSNTILYLVLDRSKTLSSCGEVLLPSVSFSLFNSMQPSLPFHREVEGKKIHLLPLLHTK